MKNSAIKTTQVHFSIEGDFITDMARTRLQEGDWRHAMKILDCLNGLPMDDKISILKGDKYLNGTNDVELKIDNRQQAVHYKQWLSQEFGKVFAFKNKFYIPYAAVSSWCSEDIPKENDIFNNKMYDFLNQFDKKSFENFLDNGQRAKGIDFQNPYVRSLHYADDPKNDMAIGIPHLKGNEEYLIPFLNQVILFKERETEVPFFFDEYMSAHPLQCLKNNPYLEERGSSQYYYQNEDEISNSYTEIKPLKNPYPNIDDEEYEDKKKEFFYTLKKQICDYADNDKEYGWKILTDEEGNSLKVPGRAFLHFALARVLSSEDGYNRTQAYKSLPEYDAFSPSGLKMPNDDRFHTDAWLGCGLSLDVAYTNNTWQNNLFFEGAMDFQKTYLDYNFHLLSRGGKKLFDGTTCTPNNYMDVPEGKRILVIPHLGVEFQDVALKCDAIIAEQGGPLAHLVIVGREINKQWPIVRIDNASVKFALSIDIHIDLIEGKVFSQEELKKNKKFKSKN